MSANKREQIRVNDPLQTGSVDTLKQIFPLKLGKKNQDLRTLNFSIILK
jgi:hypothetical protein